MNSKPSPRQIVLAMTLIFGATALAAPAPKEKDREGTKVDAGSFGVFQNGHRVGTESFSIYQTGGGSVIDSEFKSENNPPDLQSSEMRLNANGDLRRYDWKEMSPESAESSVVPNQDFLNQKWRVGEEKEHEQPYLLPVGTSILDDYFFVHREVLAWKFLAVQCKQANGQVQCPLKQRAQFGAMIPRQHSSMPLTVEYLGREKVTLRSGEQELNRLELKTDASTWHLWLDDQFKVMRMIVVGENTEVERD